MTTYTYYPKGTCSKQMEVDLEDGVIKDVRVVGGCDGSLQGRSGLVGGMKAEAIRLVSHDPKKYLGQGHIVPDVALGPNVALLNWLRAQAREVEVAYVQVGMEREDILASLNRLSSAIYVLMLLTVVAESGRDISKVGL